MTSSREQIEPLQKELPSHFAEFKKHSKDITWEAEVWFAETPEHMLHFNGDRFMGPL
jgi:hypothetical protein